MIHLGVCIVCGSSENLNTSMTIDVNGDKITVRVCDADAETTTPKLAKGCYLSKKSEIDEVIAKAKELGLEINIPDTIGEMVVVEKPPQAQVPKPSEPQAQFDQPKPDKATLAAVEGQDVLPTSIVDSAARRVHSVTGGDSGAESHAAYVPGSGQDKLDPALLEGKVKMEAGQGRGGQPMAVPAIRVDQTGTTTVRVRQDVDDHMLQRRFKELAASTNADGANRHSFAVGYDVHNCPICKGDGVVKQRGKIDTCPKCEGTGLLNS